jgi:hypothetical protein
LSVEDFRTTARTSAIDWREIRPREAIKRITIGIPRKPVFFVSENGFPSHRDQDCAELLLVEAFSTCQDLSESVYEKIKLS